MDERLSVNERAILDLASEDLYGLAEVAGNREASEAGIRGLLSKGLIALFRKIGPNSYQPVPESEYEEALSDDNWSPFTKGNSPVVFTTTIDGDRAYESGVAL